MNTNKKAPLLMCVYIFILLSGCGKSGPVETAEPVKTPEVLVTASLPTAVFTFTEDNYPVVDGSTSMAPLAEAVASVLLGKNREDCSVYAQFNRTTESFKNLINGRCDILIVSEPAQEVYTLKNEAGFSWDLSVIANDALIFVVNSDNPVDNLTTEQIRKIYAGEITNWSEVGGSDIPIEAFQRNPTAGSQALMEKLVMRGDAMMEPGTTYLVGSMEGLMEAVKSYMDSASAIGYSVYYYANDMKMAEGLKIISVDGVAPSVETIKNGEYPHISEYYAVIASDEPEGGPARVMYNWLRSEEGQSLIMREGYVPVLSSAQGVVTDYSGLAPYKADWQIFSYYYDEPLPELVPYSGYGRLLPYIGQTLYNEYGYSIGNLYGLCTEKGEIVTLPVYSRVDTARNYAYGLDDYLDVLILEKPVVNEIGNHENKAAIAAADGSWMTGFDYYYIIRVGEYITASKDGEGLTVIGPDGRELLDSADGENVIDVMGHFAVTGKLDGGERLFINLKTGERLGPFENFTEFSDGLAAVCEDGAWRYIDENGDTALIMGEGYSCCFPFHEGFAHVLSDSDESALIDTDGNIVMSGNVYGYYGHGIWFENISVSESVFCDAYNGFKEITHNGENIEYTDAGRYFYSENDEGVTLFMAGDSGGAFIPEPDSRLFAADASRVDMFLIISDNGFGYVNERGEFLLPISEGFLSYLTDTKDGGAVVSRYTENGLFDIIRTDGSVIMKDCAQVYCPYGSQYIMVTDKVSCGYISAESGEWIMRISLLEGMPD